MTKDFDEYVNSILEACLKEERTPVGGTYPPRRSGSEYAWKRRGPTNKKTHPIDREVDARGMRYNRERDRRRAADAASGKNIAKPQEEDSNPLDKFYAPNMKKKI